MTMPPLPAFKTRVLPVVVIDDAELAVPMAEALLAGGVDAIEITLRSACALDAIARVARALPAICVGAGTLTRAEDFQRVADAGARFAVSPGLTPTLAAAASRCAMAYLPGVMTPGEVIFSRECGYSLLKLFPAQQAGGLAMLQALASPFADVRFCPTGGISAATAPEFLKQPNVAMVGGSWLTPSAAVKACDWAAITALAEQVRALGAR